MIIRVAAAVSLLALAACGSEPATRVEDASARLPLVAGRPGAAYFTLHAAALPQRIVGVSSPQVARIELHDMTMDGGVMRMGPLTDTAFPGDGVLKFTQGGKHAMLFGIAPEVKAGGTIRLTFDLDPGPDVSADVPVESLAPAR